MMSMIKNSSGLLIALKVLGRVQLSILSFFLLLQTSWLYSVAPPATATVEAEMIYAKMIATNMHACSENNLGTAATDMIHMTMLPSAFMFVIGTFLFVTGMLGIFYNNSTFIMVLMKAELMYLGMNLLFVGMAVYFLDVSCFVYSLLLFGVVAAESVLGLCLFFMLMLTDNEAVLYDISDVMDDWR